MAFWDTSAIIPLCIHESRSPSALRLWRSFTEHIVWSETVVEIESVLSRLSREGLQDGAARNRAQKISKKLEGEWNPVERSDRATEMAKTFPMKYGLRALDSLQLAAALVWCKEFPKNKDFILADTRLAKAAESAGFTIHYLI